MSTVVDTMMQKGNHTHHVPEIIAADKNGEMILWVVFALMTIGTVVFSGASLRIAKPYRLFHWLTILITTTAAISYFAMATGGGKVFVDLEPVDDRIPDVPHHGAKREFLYARYIDWSLTTPLLLLDLLLTAGVPKADILLAMYADIGMILTGLFGGMETRTAIRFVYWVFACLFYVYIAYVIGNTAVASATARSASFGNKYSSIAAFTLVLWSIYPIVFLLAEGLNKIGVNAEILAYGILDVLAKPIFGLWLLAIHSSLGEAGQYKLGSEWVGHAYEAVDGEEGRLNSGGNRSYGTA